MASVNNIFTLLMIASGSWVSSLGEEMVSVPVITSRTIPDSGYNIKVNIPKECANLGYCEVVDEYPYELALRLTQEFKQKNVVQYFDTDIGVATSSIEENLCNSEAIKIKPLLVKSQDDNWYYVLNSINETVHEYNVIKCESLTLSMSTKEEEKCSGVVNPNSEHPTSTTECIQKYVERKVGVLVDEDMEPKLFLIPCCCSCVLMSSNN